MTAHEATERPQVQTRLAWLPSRVFSVPPPSRWRCLWQSGFVGGSRKNPPKNVLMFFQTHIFHWWFEQSKQHGQKKHTVTGFKKCAGRCICMHHRWHAGVGVWRAELGTTFTLKFITCDSGRRGGSLSDSHSNLGPAPFILGTIYTDRHSLITTSGGESIWTSPCQACAWTSFYTWCMCVASLIRHGENTQFFFYSSVWKQ